MTQGSFIFALLSICGCEILKRYLKILQCFWCVRRKFGANNTQYCKAELLWSSEGTLLTGQSHSSKLNPNEHSEAHKTDKAVRKKSVLISGRCRLQHTFKCTMPALYFCFDSLQLDEHVEKKKKETLFLIKAEAYYHSLSFRIQNKEKEGIKKAQHA